MSSAAAEEGEVLLSRLEGYLRGGEVDLPLLYLFLVAKREEKGGAAI